MNHHSSSQGEKNNSTSMAIIAIVAALALLGVVVVITIVTIPLQQEAEARGCKSSHAFNASKGRCFHP
jgi:hypothetical protein